MVYLNVVKKSMLTIWKFIILVQIIKFCQPRLIYIPAVSLRPKRVCLHKKSKGLCIFFMNLYGILIITVLLLHHSLSELVDVIVNLECTLFFEFQMFPGNVISILSRYVVFLFNVLQKHQVHREGIFYLDPCLTCNHTRALKFLKFWR